MGMHWRTLGYASVDAFVDAMQLPAGQLEAFVRFIERNPPLADAMLRRDWFNFAAHYNGPGQVDYYAGKIAAAFDRQSGPAAPLPPATMRLGAKGGDVAKLQAALGIKVTANSARTLRWPCGRSRRRIRR
jgi:hypothetical protein